LGRAVGLLVESHNHTELSGLSAPSRTSETKLLANDHNKGKDGMTESQSEWKQNVLKNIAPKGSADELLDLAPPMASVMAPGTGDLQDQVPAADPSSTGGTNEVPQAAVTAEESPPAGTSSLTDPVNDTPGADAEQAEESLVDGLFAGAFSEAATARLHGAFHRFVEMFSYDLEMSNLVPLVRYLGNGVTPEVHDNINRIVKSMTPYEYLDFGEFLEFYAKFLEFMHNYTKDMFEKFDEDGSGELSTRELRALVMSLGILPLNGKIKEALSTVDTDCSGQLTYEEFLLFFEAYQSSEVFTEVEVMNMQAIHKQLGTLPHGRLPLNAIADALVLYFGLSFLKEARAMELKLLEREKKEGKKEDCPEGLSFEDFLLVARELRELYHKALKNGLDEHFADCDADGSGSVSKEELLAGLEKMKYIPLNTVINEIFGEVVDLNGGENWEEGVELDFDQFFDFMLVFRQREGFLKAEVEDLFGVFNRFDEDASGAISTVELGDVFRHLGYLVSMEHLQHLVLIVDENENHSLDFKEFLHLMQLYRTSEIRGAKEIYEEHCQEDDSDVLAMLRVVPALKDLGYDSPPTELIAKLPREPLDFDSFLKLADRCRAAQVAKSRKLAGFTVHEIDRLRDSFDKFDKDHSGTISCQELLAVLDSFGWKPKTAEDRDGIMARLEKARAAVKEAGEEATPDHSSDVNFWEFVQLARMIQRHDETAHEELMSTLAHELNFTNHELAEFNEIFHQWAAKSAQDDSDSEWVHEEVGKDHQESVHKECAKRLVRSLGVKFTQERKRRFDAELDRLCESELNLDFTAFLKLMRWLIDTKFLDDPHEDDSPHHRGSAAY
jgi:Ca2+-binding EF-hand superfamily protein